MRVYLDNCCYNRPYDDQMQRRIHVETQAKLEIQDMIRNNMIELATSFILIYENSMNPKKNNRISIENFINSYETVYVNESQHKEVADVAKSFISQGIKDKDAFHVACTILAKCEYFITTDDRLLKCETNELQVVNPMEFIRRMEG